MNRYKPQFFLFLTVIFLWVSLPLQNAVANNTDYDIAIRVDGLSCPFCAYGLEKKLKRLPGAGKIHINIEKGIAHIDVSEGKTVSEEEIKEAVEDAGFTAKKITYGKTQQ